MRLLCLIPSFFRLNYFVLLYRAEFHDELISCYKNFRDPTLAEATIAMASLAKMGTPEAFATATEILRQGPISHAGPSNTSGGRAVSLYAYLAIKVGQYGAAFDVLTDLRRVRKPSKFTSNLKILILESML
jgi:hypothetical protein